MGQQSINIGSTANDGTGDTLRDGGDKINDNFTELYTTTIILKYTEIAKGKHEMVHTWSDFLRKIKRQQK